MVNRADPNVYEIGQGLDLLSNDAAEYDLRANNYTIGVGSYIRKFTGKGAYTDENFDLSLFFEINAGSMKFKESGQEYTEAKLVECDKHNPNLDIILKNS
jgi:hypothetical protein